MTISKTKQQLLDFIATRIFSNGNKQVTAQMNREALNEIVNAAFPVGVNYSKISAGTNILSQETVGWYQGAVPAGKDGYYYLNAEVEPAFKSQHPTNPSFVSLMVRVNGVKVWQTNSAHYGGDKLILSLVVPLREDDIVVIQSDGNKQLNYASCVQVL